MMIYLIAVQDIVIYLIAVQYIVILCLEYTNTTFEECIINFLFIKNITSFNKNILISRLIARTTAWVYQ